VADAAAAQFIHQQRRCNRQVGAAEIAGGVTAEQQGDSQQLPPSEGTGHWRLYMQCCDIEFAILQHVYVAAVAGGFTSVLVDPHTTVHRESAACAAFAPR
jgi:hypothetical protein